MVKRNSERVTGLFTADAENMRRIVAFARELGGVAVTLINTFNPDSLLAVAEQQRQYQLDQPSSYLVERMRIAGRGDDARLNKELRHRNIWTVRDIFTVGTDWLDLNDHMTTRLKNTAAEEFPDEKLKDDPTPADVADFCHDLSQVTASAVHFRFNTKRRDFQDEKGTPIPYKKWLSLADILDGTPKLRNVIINFDKVRDDAMRFAAEFADARRNM